MIFALAQPFRAFLLTASLGLPEARVSWFFRFPRLSFASLLAFFDRLEQSGNSNDIYRPCQVVAQRGQTEFGPHFLQPSHQEPVMAPQPHRPKHVLHQTFPQSVSFRMGFEALRRSLNCFLAFPSLYRSILAFGAFGFERTLGTGGAVLELPYPPARFVSQLPAF